MSSLAELPLLLRAESFGGVLFDPADATFLEVDREAFELLRGYAVDPGLPLGPEEARLLGEVRESVTRLDGRPIRVVDLARDGPGPVPTLSAPSLVDFQITDRCHLGCPHCYADSTPRGAHATLRDVELALEQIAEVGAFQVALGGGEPLLHPELPRILARCHALGLVPNLTTSGFGLDDRTLGLVGRYCGAVGLSLEGVGEPFDRYRATGFAYFRRTLARLRAQGVPTVLQVTLNAETFARLGSIVEFCRREEGLYGVIFLAFKPVGRGASFGEPLAALPARAVHERLQAAFFSLADVTRVGFDCCLTPAVTGTGSDFDAHAARYLEGCSALRSSVGLLPNLDVLPCTFTPTHCVGNLRRQHLREIWSALAARGFREDMAARARGRHACGSCAKYDYCLGGCPVMDLVDCSRGYLRAGREGGRVGH
ncbi:radical SAM/SPASM domain-containing protein [Thiohalocapsa sp. ML1]|jgi:radical SAM protein with 4Fe4S-binding SPASM domain|uniref:radical SAM/SPASM domain-containing protein n=1 Tax=Thiohalocapsa sp. ML1 TaxID=1431688 RepID=UPI000732250D|nr:radical SAM protein [Thiohalocapsa sp. ML1]